MVISVKGGEKQEKKETVVEVDRSRFIEINYEVDGERRVLGGRFLSDCAAAVFCSFPKILLAR